ncbi:MAG TPA: N-formylglutamate amidohydrolase [Alphaproteobacteria bacterium]|nr:N-formylglutamate amidohydrolase [Alphaproteobacteria bacterium]
MALQPYLILKSSRPNVVQAPLVVDSPHSGRAYPPDFEYACPLQLLRQTEDSYVDELVAGAAEAGATVIVAEFPRCYIDLNRAEDDIDPAVLGEPWPISLQPSDRTLQGLGLIRRLCRSGVPVYREPLKVAEVQKRIENFYRPYHGALEKTLAKKMSEFGVCYLINAHSMPGQSSEGLSSARPDFVLGDRIGTSCDPSFTRRAREILQDMGYSVALNNPYMGVEIVRRYGLPQQGQHALQLEINRKLYMNEQTLEKTAGFARLQKGLTTFFQLLAAELIEDMSDRLAAE